MENPFRVLGLDRDLIRRLDDRTIARLVEQQYRFLQKVFHPDVGGDPRMSQALNEARSALDRERNPESYDRYKTAYVGRAAATVERETLKARAGLAQVRFERLLDGLLRYLSCRLEADKDPNIFTSGPLSIGLHDLVLGRTLPPSYRRDDGSRVFFELRVGRNHGLTAYRPDRPPERYTARVLVGVIPRAVESGPDNPLARLVKAMAPGSGAPGSRYAALAGRAGSAQDLRRISPDAMRPLADYMSPFLKKDGVLFTAGADDKGLHFILEGRINTIARG